MQTIKAPNGHPIEANSISLRCPSCRQQGTFDPFLLKDVQCISIQGAEYAIVGIRRCPNRQCRAVAYVVLKNGVTVASYPPERFDFDPTNIPAPILKVFEEAVSCQAVGAFTASAMMVRKSLELLCEDRGATGSNLQNRIKALGTKIVIPKELLEGIDDLRLLGNDAAHVEARTYDDIGPEEVGVALELTKEVLKATYQLADLLGRLRALKKNPSAPLAGVVVTASATPTSTP